MVHHTKYVVLKREEVYPNLCAAGQPPLCGVTVPAVGPEKVSDNWPHDYPNNRYKPMVCVYTKEQSYGEPLGFYERMYTGYILNCVDVVLVRRMNRLLREEKKGTLDLDYSFAKS